MFWTESVMHDILVDELEKHLSGGASQAFYDHLDTCSECHAAMAEMAGISRMVGELKSIGAPEPPLGFYQRVAGRIIEDQRKEAWGIFSPGAAFFRRIAFASLLLLAGLGSFLVTKESSAGGTDAATIMAQHDATGVRGESSDRDRLLVTLATYQQ
jgi:predicted anti-sigma-YlaC factor YlaD